ncbi:hypothetical protein GCM10007898_30460 [Dyella flagellata]|uniref:Uncharacterized protein n=1 Tax=Dyella flagellata TaxID=1867833 RepID=A0ABQ5XFY5_9GAMM|nr:hypothetical protein GCM10007898_30460 [Dyella flagellata]
MTNAGFISLNTHLGVGTLDGSVVCGENTGGKAANITPDANAAGYGCFTDSNLFDAPIYFLPTPPQVRTNTD